MSGLLEESVAVELQDLDDVVIPVEKPSLNNGHGQLPSTSVVEFTESTTASGATSPIEERSEDTINDEDVCREFIEKTCGCKKVGGRPCSSQFSLAYYLERQAQASVLNRNELDLVMLGSIMATTRTDEDVTHGRHKPIKRQRPRANYLHNGCEVCKVTFGFIFGVGRKHRIDAIRSHYLDEGLATRVHKNSTLRPHNALTFNEITSIANFVQNYAEQRAILLPGRIPQYKQDDIKLLPSSETKKVFYTQ